MKITRKISAALTPCALVSAFMLALYMACIGLSWNYKYAASAVVAVFALALIVDTKAKNNRNTKKSGLNQYYESLGDKHKINE